MFLALALVLPFLTGQIQQIGNMLCPMHIPVMLCGYFCGPLYGFAVGFAAPIVRFFVFGMPPLVPLGIPMSLELACYGTVCGLLYKLLPKTKPCIYISLLGSMLCGRAVWGLGRLVMYGLGKCDFSMAAFIAGAFTTALPGIVLQFLVIPLLVMILNKYTDKR